MKRIILLLFITISLESLFALSYSPDISLDISTNFTYYEESVDPYDGYRETLAYKARINPFAITIEENKRISLPASLSYIQKTKVIDRYFIQERVRFSLGLEFDYIFSNSFALSIAPGVGYTYFPKINAGNLQLSLETGPIFIINRYLSLSLPIKAIFAAKEVEFEVSIGCSIYPFGITSRSKK